MMPRAPSVHLEPQMLWLSKVKRIYLMVSMPFICRRQFTDSQTIVSLFLRHFLWPECFRLSWRSSGRMLLLPQEPLQDRNDAPPLLHPPSSLLGLFSVRTGHQTQSQVVPSHKRVSCHFTIHTWQCGRGDHRTPCIWVSRLHITPSWNICVVPDCSVKHR